MHGDVPSDWHREFFRGLWIEVQERSFDAEQTRELAEAAQEALQVVPGARILDVPCGDGRVALELAARGFELTGIERSEELLDLARRHAEERGLRLDLRAGDMWDLGDVGRHDAALCLWSSIGYGSEEQDRRFFTSLASALGDDGALLLETHVVESLLPQWEDQGWRWAGEIAVGESRRFDHESGRVETDWVLAGPEHRERRQSSLRLYTYRELARLLRECGFDEFEAYGSPELEPFEIGSSRLLLVARKGEAADGD